MHRFLKPGLIHSLTVAALFAVIFVAHIAYIPAMQLPQRDERLRGKKIEFRGLRLYDDEDQYLTIAQHLLDQGMLSLDGERPTATRVPLYPLALAGALALSPGMALALGLNCLLTAFLALLCYALARLFWTPAVGLAAMAAAGLSPHTFNWFLWMQAEALAAVLIAAFLLSFVLLLRTRFLRYAWLCGILAGLAALTRPETVLLVPIYLLFLLWYCLTRKISLVRLALPLALAAALTLAPWLVRNHLVMGAASLSTLGGFTFLGAHNDRALAHPGSWYAFLAFADPGELKRVEALPEPVQDRYLWSRGVRWLKEQRPVTVLSLELHKLHRTFKPSFRVWGKEFGREALHLILTLPFVLLFLFAVTGGLVRQCRDPDRERRAQFLALWLVWLVPLAVTLIFWGVTRFRAPYEPVAFTLGVGALTDMLARRRPASSE